MLDLQPQGEIQSAQEEVDDFINASSAERTVKEPT
jgi:hypothetical protein